MSKINIYGNVSGDTVQIGDNNKILAESPLGEYESELLQLFNAHCPTSLEKKTLLDDLRKLDVNPPSPETSKHANNILNFILSIGSGIASNGLFLLLTELAKNQ